MIIFETKESQVKLCKWIEKQHFKLFESTSISMLSEAYLGVYANRPTSWLAVMARNNQLEMENAIGNEESNSLIRIPAMRRSKFIAPLSLANELFLATRADLNTHNWRLKDVGLTVDDYFNLLPGILALANKNDINPKNLAVNLSIRSCEARALINVATYMGDLVRVPSANSWSNQWEYAPSPKDFAQLINELSELKVRIINRYINHYGPVTLNDISWWTGFSKQEISSLMSNINAVEIAKDMWMTFAKADDFWSFDDQESSGINAIRFLPAWDPLLMGYSPQSIIRKYLNLNEIGAYDNSGNGKPVIFWGSKAIGCWKSKIIKSKRYMWIEQTSIDNVESEQLHRSAEMWAKRIGVIYLFEAPDK